MRLFLIVLGYPLFQRFLHDRYQSNEKVENVYT